MTMIAMDVTKPYKSLWFWAMDVTKPYQSIGFGAMNVTKPYESIGFGAIDDDDDDDDGADDGEADRYSSSYGWLPAHREDVSGHPSIMVRRARRVNPIIS